MTYQELKLRYPNKKFGQVNVRRKYKFQDIGQSKVEFEDRDVFDGEDWEVYMDHSCDEWVIGNTEDAIQFSSDLLRAIEYCRSN